MQVAVEILRVLWPVEVKCGVPDCGGKPDRHAGQHGGVRAYICPKCQAVWSEAPIGFQIRDEYGDQRLVESDYFDGPGTSVQSGKTNK